MVEPLSSAHHKTIVADLNSIALRVDEAIGRNATNSYTRSALRDIRDSITGLREKIDTLSKSANSMTKREIEILHLLAHGKSALLIAAELSVSEPTVKTHLASIYRKLNVKNKVNALAQAKVLGLLPK